LKLTCYYSDAWQGIPANVRLARRHFNAFVAQHPELDVSAPWLDYAESGGVYFPSIVMCLPEIEKRDVFACYRPRLRPVTDGVRGEWMAALRMRKQIIVDDEKEAKEPNATIKR
jgi:hypothetical protein